VYERVSRQEFCEAIASDVSVLLGEFHTFMAFLGRKVDEQSHPTNADVEDLFAAFRCKTFVLRYGVGSISRQMICRRENGSAYQTLEDKATEYETTPDAEKLGFGDRLTADLIRRFGAELWKP
jgi:hypothetical protein